jgi:hypothetical protein
MYSTCYSCRISIKLYYEFYRQVFEKVQSLNFMKIRPLGAELFLEEGRT